MDDIIVLRINHDLMSSHWSLKALQTLFRTKEKSIYQLSPHNNTPVTSAEERKLNEIRAGIKSKEQSPGIQPVVMSQRDNCKLG